ncbi:MAG: hypothetical protein JXR48_04255 [Candidatus Delongbacteria bacterium]|nr:hypothetical protein [Candidatus Delongbacteria bacterium]
MKKYYWVLFLFLTTIVIADTFQIQSNLKSKEQKKDNKEMIQAEGYSSTYDDALKQAFSSAIEQFIGVIVSHESYVKNYVTIKDELFSASNGFIEEYEIIEKKIDDKGVYYVKILAKVKQQNIYEKAKSLNLDVKKLDEKLLRNLYSRVSTKKQTKKEVETMFKNKLENLFSKKSILETIDVKITNATFKEDEEQNNKIPLLIKYDIICNEDVYNSKVNELRDFLNNLNFKCEENFDRFKPGVSYGSAGNSKYYNLVKTNFGIIQKRGKSYSADLWEFPKEWKNIYPFSITWDNQPKPKIRNSFKLVLEIKDKKNNILYLEDLTNYSISEYQQLYTTCYSYGLRSYSTEWMPQNSSSHDHSENTYFISPFFNIKDKTTLSKAYKILIDLKDVEKISDITLKKQPI